MKTSKPEPLEQIDATNHTINDSSSNNSNSTKGTHPSLKEIIDVDDDRGNSISDSETDLQTKRFSPQHDNEYEFESIDVIWLKKDVRWTDHGPLSEVAGGGGEIGRAHV